MHAGPVAKITRPALKRVAARKRLFAQLDRILRRHPIAWVSAPAGSGKTTLAASWLAARRRPCLWYQLDAADADAATFFYYQREAVRRLAPRRRETLPLLTPEYALGIGVFARNFCEGVGARVPRDTVMVIDDYQALPDNAPLQALLPQALPALSDGVRVLVLSRAAPPPSFARLITEGAVRFIDAEELDLSAAETRALARARVGRRVAAAEIDALRAQTGGWVAGTVLLLEARTRSLPAPRATRTAPQQLLFDYFASEIFGRAPADAQRLLLATALLPDVGVPAAEALSGEPRAGEILSDLVRRNYFTLRLAGHEPRYRYHPLFREFLLLTGQRLLSAEQLLELRREGGRLLEEAGQPDSAVELFREASSFGDVAGVALRNAPAMLAAGRASTLARWLESLPQETLDRQPWLLHWLGLSIAPSRPAEGHRHLERCFELFRPGADAATLYSVWSSAASTYLYRWDTGGGLARWVFEWDELRRRHPRFPAPEIEQRAASVIFAALVFSRPRHPELPYWKLRCMNLVRAGGDQQRPAAASAFALFCHLYWSGQHEEAGEVIASLGPTSSATRDPVAAVVWGIAKAMLRWLREGMSPSVLQEFEGVLDLTRRSGIHVWDFLINAHCAYFVEDVDTAEGFLRDAARALDATDRIQTAYHRHGEALLALRRGDNGRAVERAERAIELARETAGFTTAGYFAEIVARVTLTLALVETGEMTRAASELERLRELTKEAHGHFADYLCSLTEAFLDLRQGEEVNAVVPLRSAMAIGAAHSIFVAPCFTREQMATLCALALARDVEVDYVRQLITRRELAAPEEAVFDERWPRAINVFMLGRFELWRDGERVSFTGKVQRKPLELLRALVALGGEGVRQDALVDALWPDPDGDTAAHALETTVYRLRKVLGAAEAVVLQGRRMSLDPQVCWVDALALSGRLRRALELVKRPQVDADEVRREAERILELYRGPLVAGGDTRDPAEVLRGRLRVQLSRFLHEAALHLDREGESGVAGALLARVREADPELESLSRSTRVA